MNRSTKRKRAKDVGQTELPIGRVEAHALIRWKLTGRPHSEQRIEKNAEYDKKQMFGGRCRHGVWLALHTYNWLSGHL